MSSWPLSPAPGTKNPRGYTFITEKPKKILNHEVKKEKLKEEKNELSNCKSFFIGQISIIVLSALSWPNVRILPCHIWYRTIPGVSWWRAQNSFPQSSFKARAFLTPQINRMKIGRIFLKENFDIVSETLQRIKNKLQKLFKIGISRNLNKTV